MSDVKTLGIGFYFDELEPGMKFKTLNRTITEPDIVGFIGVTGMVETLFTDLSLATTTALYPAALQTCGAQLYDHRRFVVPAQHANDRFGFIRSEQKSACASSSRRHYSLRSRSFVGAKDE